MHNFFKNNREGKLARLLVASSICLILTGINLLLLLIALSFKVFPHAQEAKEISLTLCLFLGTCATTQLTKVYHLAQNYTPDGKH